jgi:putative NADH-flavin reductase
MGLGRWGDLGAPRTLALTFRLGTNQLIANAQGSSSISMEEYAIALVDELEKPAHKHARFTIGY